MLISVILSKTKTKCIWKIQDDIMIVVIQISHEYECIELHPKLDWNPMKFRNVKDWLNKMVSRKTQQILIWNEMIPKCLLNFT